MTEKDARIIKHGEETETPIFVLTAKDKNSLKALQDYFDTCMDTGCDEDHLIAISMRITEFLTWQSDNPDKVKLPD